MVERIKTKKEFRKEALSEKQPVSDIGIIYYSK